MDITKLIKKAQGLQAQYEQTQKELALVEMEGRSGGGMVKIVLNGLGQMKGVKIDPSLLRPAEIDILEDLLITAFTDAKTKVGDLTNEKLKSFARDIPPIPGVKLPFQ